MIDHYVTDDDRAREPEIQPAKPPRHLWWVWLVVAAGIVMLAVAIAQWIIGYLPTH